MSITSRCQHKQQLFPRTICVVVSCPVWCGSCTQKACVPPSGSDICTVSRASCSPVPDPALASIVLNSGSLRFINSLHECISCLKKANAEPPKVVPKPSADHIMTCLACSCSFRTECSTQYGPKSSLLKVVSLSKKVKNFTFHCEPCQSMQDLAELLMCRTSVLKGWKAALP